MPATSSPAVEPDGDQPRESWRDILMALPRGVRAVLYAALALLLVLALLAVTGVVLVRRAFPETGGEVDLPGLDADVTVIRDEHGIPQIYGDSVEDLMRAQGYVAAQERFYEMDVRRHITSGRLSEMFGEDTLEVDKTVRTLGWRKVAEEELGLVSPDTRRALEAYAEGVNGYLDSHDPSEIAVEYTVLRAGGLDYRPEDWTPADSLAWLKAMAWDLRSNVEDETSRALLSAHADADDLAQLYPEYDEHNGPLIVGRGAVVDGVFEPNATEGGTRNPQRPAYTAGQRRLLAGVADTVAAMPELVGRGPGIGSNSWVVDGDHSTTGAPLLANDPHLSVSVPGVWMQVGLHCRSVSADCPLDVAGFSFSGVPGVVIGHNADIAWGFTNLGPDTSDLFLERVKGDRWRHGKEWKPLREREETIEVHGGDEVTLRIRETDHGPLLSDVSADLSTVGANASDSSPYAVALAWSALRPMPTADAILGFNTASNWTEFRTAARKFAVPAQNLIYADREGHIGYQAPGWIPIRRTGNDGRMPSEGWRPENDWTGQSVPFDALPQLFDPEEGVIVTANQKPIDDAYPFDLGSDWDPGYRAGRISRLLGEQDAFGIDDMSRLQLDDRNPIAPMLVPHLLRLDAGSRYYNAGRALLRDWDFNQPADSAAAAYFNAVWSHLLARTFHDDLRASLRPDGGARWMQVMTTLLEEPDSRWWDDLTTDDVIETRDDMIVLAMRDARDDLTAHLSEQPEDWTWGALHHLDLRNSTLGESGVAAVEWLVNRDDWDVAGGSAAVNATNWDASQGYRVSSAPSMRMVVSLADLDDSRWISLTGVSGHPGNAHYTDQTGLWARGETLPWAFSSDAVERAGSDTMTLRAVAAADE